MVRILKACYDYTIQKNLLEGEELQLDEQHERSMILAGIAVPVEQEEEPKPKRSRKAK